MKINPFLKIFTISLLLYIPLASSRNIEHEHDNEFGYGSGAENGPEHWGEMNSNWTKCGTGHQQSPIDLLNERVVVKPDLGKLRRSYLPAEAVMHNRGHDIELKWKEDAGSITIDGTRYDLKQLHWHFPAEHTINGQRYVVEMHIVHKTSDDQIAVIGFLYKYGEPDPFLAELEPYIKEISNIKDKEKPVGLVDPRHIKHGGKKYFRYIGSLTTPPCTEGVVWTILRKIRTISKEQVQLLKEAVKEEVEENARPLQDINDRNINLYRPNN